MTEQRSETAPSECQKCGKVKADVCLRHSGRVHCTWCAQSHADEEIAAFRRDHEDRSASATPITSAIALLLELDVKDEHRRVAVDALREHDALVRRSGSAQSRAEDNEHFVQGYDAGKLKAKAEHLASQSALILLYEAEIEKYRAAVTRFETQLAEHAAVIDAWCDSGQAPKEAIEMWKAHRASPCASEASHIENAAKDAEREPDAGSESHRTAPKASEAQSDSTTKKETDNEQRKEVHVHRPGELKDGGGDRAHRDARRPGGPVDGRDGGGAVREAPAQPGVVAAPNACKSCETRPASTWCNGCLIEDYQAACGCAKCVVRDSSGMSPDGTATFTYQEMLAYGEKARCEGWELAVEQVAQRVEKEMGDPYQMQARARLIRQRFAGKSGQFTRPDPKEKP